MCPWCHYKLHMRHTRTESLAATAATQGIGLSKQSILSLSSIVFLFLSHKQQQRWDDYYIYPSVTSTTPGDPICES